MPPKLAKCIFLFLIIVSIPAALFPIYEFFRVMSSAQEYVKQIEFDGGIFFLLLMSEFWLFCFIEYSGINRKHPLFIKKYAAKMIVYWFVAVLALAYIFSYLLVLQLEHKGYQKCDIEHYSSRISRGEIELYQLGRCD